MGRLQGLVTRETRYARSGDVHIAYQVIGDGPIDLIYVPTWISQVEAYWEEPTVSPDFQNMLDRIGSPKH